MDPLVRAEVNRDALAENVAGLRRITAPSARLMVAVKADGYGHGALEVARIALASGADALGVARIEEAFPLRAAGIDAPILIFGHTPPNWAAHMLDQKLTPSLFSVHAARELASAVDGAGSSHPLPVHLKVDTGMGRLGFLDDAFRAPSRDSVEEGVTEEIATVSAIPSLTVEGIYTHFAASDITDKSDARRQFERFTRLLEVLERRGIQPPVCHAANSGAIMEMPETHLDMVRAGIAVYGLYPSSESDRTRLALRPAMALKSAIVHLKSVPAGFAVSYGSTHVTERPTVIATVPLGYADGYSRRFSNTAVMLVGGHRVPVVGRVCMDLTMIDVGHVPDVAVGDEVVAFGTQGAASVPADELAAIGGTINYEIVSAITGRVPRIYGNDR